MRIITCSSFTAALIGLLIATFLDTLMVSAWSIAGGGVTTTTGMTPSMSTRRLFVKSAASSISAAAAGAIVQPAQASAVSNKADLIEDLRVSKEKLQAIPALLEEKEWDKVRSILKLPPVNKLWNLGDSQNIVLQLAKETGNIDLFEIKEELSYNLQICDQLTYDNAFVYYQPGNGKFKIKEPQQLAVMAMQQIQQAIDLANE